MKPKYMRSILFAVCFIFLMQIAFSNDVFVKREFNNRDYNTNDIFESSLVITNPHNFDLTIKLYDDFVIQNQGIKIECLEKTIPKNSSIQIIYPNITLYKSGVFNIPVADVKYKINDTEKTKKTISKNITVKGNDIQSTLSSIETIYQCGGMNIRSSSTSQSGGNFNVQINTGNDVFDNMNNMFNSIDEQFNKMFNNMNPSNNNPNSNSPKISHDPMDYIQKQIEEQKKQNSINQNNVQNPNSQTNPNLNQQNNQNPLSQNQNPLMQEIQQNPEFQKAKEYLEKQGYVENKTTQTTNTNHDEMKFNYKKNSSNPFLNQEANILVKLKDGNVTLVEIEKNNFNKLLFSLLIAFLLVSLFLFYFINSIPEKISKNKKIKKTKRRVLLLKKTPFCVPKHSKMLLLMSKKYLNKEKSVENLKQSAIYYSKAIKIFLKQIYNIDLTKTNFSSLKQRKIDDELLDLYSLSELKDFTLFCEEIIYEPIIKKDLQKYYEKLEKNVDKSLVFFKNYDCNKYKLN